MSQKRYIFLVIALSLLQPGTPLSASELGLWYTGANPDYKPFSTDYGFGLTWQQELTENTALTVLFNDTEFNPSGPVVGRLLVDSWAEVDYQYHLDSNFYLAASYTSVDTTNGTYDGLGIHIGYKKEWNNELSSVIQFGHIDTKFSDFQLEGTLRYQVTDDVSVALGLRDYNVWDYTAYEAGIIYNY